MKQTNPCIKPFIREQTSRLQNIWKLTAAYTTLSAKSVEHKGTRGAPLRLQAFISKSAYILLQMQNMAVFSPITNR